MKRNTSIDLIKILGMLCIIALHVFSYSVNDWQLSNVIYDFSVIGVPLFLMSTGFLLLGESKASEINYLIIKIFRIIRLLSLVVFFYAICSYLHIINFGSFRSIILSLVLQKYPLYHLWYLLALIIIYLFLPVLNHLYKNKRLFIFVISALPILEFIIFSAFVTNGWDI